MLEGLKHFTVVGLGFALIAGWLLTLAMNTLLGTVLHALLGAPPESYYLGSAVLTVVSISLIALCVVFGNRVFRRRFVPAPLPFSSLLISTGLFLVLVLAFVLPQLLQVLRQYADNTHYFYHHSSELLLMFSLPLARLVLLPAAYFVISKSALHGIPST
jgi:hypothetical protein